MATHQREKSEARDLEDGIAEIYTGLHYLSCVLS